MLKCGHCRYELTGLVKGPEAVVCPECGGRTEHVNGIATGPTTAWGALGQWAWRGVYAPTVCSGLIMVLFLVQPWLPIRQFLIYGCAVVGGVSVLAGLAAALSPRLGRFEWRERIDCGRRVVVIGAILLGCWLGLVAGLVYLLVIH